MRGAWTAVAVAIVAVVGFVALATIAPSILLGPRRPGATTGQNGTVPSGASTVDFTSSVDGAHLTYILWTPTNYTPAGNHSLLFFLHGVESSNECANVPDFAGGASMINAALGAGWLVASACTRVADGWYVNSPHTGPEEQDVLDAIAHEESLTAIDHVYLVGMSMGSDGALSIATNHPGLFTGVAAVAPCTDLFEESSYYLQAHGVLPPGFAQVAGTGPTELPPVGSVGYGMEYRLSAFRFYPTNLSALRIYLVAGGNDQTCVDNAQFWPWLHANDTVLTSSCDVAAAAGEPADCSTPIAALAAAHPGEFRYRFVYEPTAPHTFDQLNGPDLVAFFEGKVPTGSYVASIGGTPQPAPPG